MGTGHFPLDTFPPGHIPPDIFPRTSPPGRSAVYQTFSHNRTQRKMFCNQWLKWEIRSGGIVGYIHFWSPCYNTAYY